jgi:Flp pilus assembly protein TadG
MTARRRRGKDDGYAMPFLAITLVVLLGFAGLGVDFWQWWHATQRLQRAADASALAGVIYLPGNSTSARATAVDAAVANGYVSGDVQTFTSSDDPALRPNQMRVQVTQTVRNGFLGVFGIQNTTIRRDATAEYSGTVPMGSPINQMGNQPTPPGDVFWPGASSDVEATNPHIWAQIAGPSNNKGNGDRFTAGVCSSGFHGCANGSTNDDYRASGYWYTVRVTVSNPANQRLAIELFDPAFVQVGDNCTSFRSSNDAALMSSLNGMGPRYATGQGPFCTGDNSSSSPVPAYGTGSPTVSFTVYQPDGTPWNYTDNPRIDVPRCRDDDTDPTDGYGNIFRPYGSVAGETADALATQAGTAGSYANAVFRRWVRMCEVQLNFGEAGISAAGTYDFIVNARTGPGMGHNRYAMRAGITNTTGVFQNGAAVSIFANEHMPLYQNDTASTASFFLARVTGGAANRTLVVNLFDTGDGSGSGSIEVIPPPDANYSSFTGCSVTTSPANFSPSLTNCRLNGVSSAQYNGHLTSLRVPIPADYTCNQASAVGCWVRVRFAWCAGCAIQDTTTWSAAILGDPVRLVE